MTKTSLTAAIAAAFCAAGAAVAAPLSPPPASAAPGAHFRECRHCPEMVVIPAGSFTMGSPEGEAGRFANEGPQRPVTIARSFAMGVTHVTRAEYRRFVRATGRPNGKACRIFDGDKKLVSTAGKNWRRPGFTQTGRHPVVCLSWDDAQAYVAWINGQLANSNGKGSGPYRLPTEAEWEYAARAGTTTPYYWGATALRGAMNYGPDEPVFRPTALGVDRWKYTSPVRSFPANRFGLFDMAGNAWQFVADCWQADYAGAPQDGSTRITSSCAERVVRGGSWLKPPTGERSAKRGEAKPDDLAGNHEIGLRLVRDLAPR